MMIDARKALVISILAVCMEKVNEQFDMSSVSALMGKKLQEFMTKIVKNI